MLCVCVCVCVLGDRLSVWAPPTDEEGSGVSPVILSLWGCGTGQGESNSLVHRNTRMLGKGGEVAIGKVSLPMIVERSYHSHILFLLIAERCFIRLLFYSQCLH